MAGRDPPVLIITDWMKDTYNRRVPARQPSSFSLAKPQRKRTKRNGSLAVGIMSAKQAGFIRSRYKEMDSHLRREEKRGPMDSAPSTLILFAKVLKWRYLFSPSERSLSLQYPSDVRAPHGPGSFVYRLWLRRSATSSRCPLPACVEVKDIGNKKVKRHGLHF